MSCEKTSDGLVCVREDEHEDNHEFRAAPVIDAELVVPGTPNLTGKTVICPACSYEFDIP